MSADNTTPSSAKPSPALPIINNKASLRFSLLRSSFSLSHSSPATTSKYTLPFLAAQNEDITLNLPHHNAGIDSKPTVENRKKEANEELRRRIMGRSEGVGKTEKEGGVIGEESDEDEEVGRSGVGRAKRVKKEVQVGETVAEKESIAGKKVEDMTKNKMETLTSKGKSGATATTATTPNGESNSKKKKNKKKRKAPSE